MTRYARLLTLAAGAVLACTTVAQAADPSGTWKWTFNRQGQEIEFTLELKAEGEKLTGTVSLPFGDGFTLDIQDGTFKNDEVSFKTVFERDGNSFETKYKGKLDGDTIKGTTERERNGEVVSREWEAKREKK